MSNLTEWIIVYRKNGKSIEDSFERYADAVELAESLEAQGYRVKLLEKNHN